MSRATRRPGGTPDDSRPVDVRRTGGRRRPAALVVVVGLVLLQAGLLMGLGGVWAVGLVRGAGQLRAASLFLVLFALGVAAVLVMSARGLWAGHRWARSPVLTWQIFLVVMAIGWFGAEPAPWAVGVLASAVAVAVGLLLPSVVAATVERPGLGER